jgi:hypothetical protein
MKIVTLSLKYKVANYSIFSFGWFKIGNSDYRANL